MTRKVFLFELLLIVALFFAILALYPHLPAVVATHWNGNLQPDGYSPKWALFLLGPGLMAGLTAFTYLGPWLSPAKFQVESFHATYGTIMLLVFCAVAYCMGITLWAAAGHATDAGRALLGGVCLLFILLGNVMGKVRRNFFIGIKTPWSLASEHVWNATHHFAAKTFVLGGLVALTGTVLHLRILPGCALLVAALAPVIYSLVLYKQLERRSKTL
jgi:uncharacterized membrane protein